MATKPDLIDAIDILNEARDLNEAAFMAAEGLKTAQHRNALTRLSCTIADRLKDVDALLNSIRAEQGR